MALRRTQQIGPMTRAQQERIDSRSQLKDARLRNDIQNVINGCTQAEPFTSTQGCFLRVGNRRIRLQHVDGSLTRAGIHYHEHPGEEPP